ncbi:hypothetical protein SAMN04489800_4686 [Pseudomonas deceptionensis]|uniref:Uncharacterized protein n=1 Tax=Pseudomonas deceptionensis TaxID=882211 RepID=A0A1H5P7R2_PSEDM|nr:hypothetical protein SAMN04489800_4686 [Pseudomonas deceptionensis]
MACEVSNSRWPPSHQKTLAFFLHVKSVMFIADDPFESIQGAAS